MGLEPEKLEGGYGLNCPQCWADGKPWEDQDIPAIVFAHFSDIIACPTWCDAPNGVFTLYQDPLFPCRWLTEIPNWCQGHPLEIDWRLTVLGSLLEAWLPDISLKYFHSGLGQCQTYFTNEYFECPGVGGLGHSGIGIIT